MSLPTQIVHLTLAKQLLQEVDAAAAAQYVNRSEYIRQATVEKLRRDKQPVQQLPMAEDFNIFMTDTQLDELFEVIRGERQRRSRRTRVN